MPLPPRTASPAAQHSSSPAVASSSARQIRWPGPAAPGRPWPGPRTESGTTAGHGEEVVDPLGPLGEGAANDPDRPHRRADPQPGLGVAVGQAAAENLAHIRAPQRRTGGTRRPAPTTAPGSSPCRSRATAPSRAACSRAVGRSMHGGLARPAASRLSGVLADRLQHPVPDLRRALPVPPRPATCQPARSSRSSHVGRGSMSSAQTCSAISSDQLAHAKRRRSRTCSGPDSRS